MELVIIVFALAFAFMVLLGIAISQNFRPSPPNDEVPRLNEAGQFVVASSPPRRTSEQGSQGR